MKKFTRYIPITTKIFLAIVFCCLSFEGFATSWTTVTAGPVTTLANWSDGTTTPTSFTTPGDTWTITLAMTLPSTGSWTVGTATMTPDTVTIATGGALNTSGAGGTATIAIYGDLEITGGTFSLGGAGTTENADVYGNVDMSGGTLSSGGATSILTMNTYGNYNMTGGTVTTATAAGGIITININGNFNMSAGTVIAGGSSCKTNIKVYGNGSFNGTSAMTNTGAGCTSTVHFCLPSGSGIMQIDNTSTGAWSGTNIYVDTACTAQLDDNFSTTTGTAAYGLTVNGTLICPAAYMVNGASMFTLNGVATLEVAIATGINGAIITTGTKTFNTSANYVFNGAAPQVTGTYLPPSLVAPSTLTISNSAGVTLSQTTATTGTLAFTIGILYTTSACTMSTPGTAGSVTGAGATSYVNGTLIKTISGLTTINYEVGDLDYAPMALTLSVATTAGSIGLMATYGIHPSIATSGLSTSNMANHYWTISEFGVPSPAMFMLSATYNAADIIGGSNSAFLTQEYSGAAWLAAALPTTNTSSPYTSAPNTGIPITSLAGDYIFGNLACGTLPITGTPTMCAGATTTLTDATTGGTWSSSSTTVATVSGGVVTGVAAGTAIISYTASACTTTLVVTVNDVPVAGAITGVTSVCIGFTTPLTDGSTGGVWSSSATGIATVSGGVVTGVATGNATISYTITNSCGTATATVNVTVGTTLSVAPVSGADSVCPGSTVTLSDATGGGAWSSRFPSIATVSGTGVVTGLVPGIDTIIYTVTNSCGTDSAELVMLVSSASPCSTTFVNSTTSATTELKVFPNPNAGAFTVNLLSGIDEDVKIVITNMVGEKVKELVTTTNRATDIQIATPGVYLISASGVHGRYVTKAIVE